MSMLKEALISDVESVGSDDEASTPSFRPSDVMHMTVLSRLVEPLRFTVGPSIIEERVTLESLRQAFAEHCQHDLVISAAELSKLGGMLAAAGLRNTTRVAIRDINAQLGDIWTVIDRDHSTPLDVTFGDVFDYEFPSFPESTEEQRETLRGLCDREVVTVADVTSSLKVDAGEQIVEFIFASGSSVIPREVFKDIVGCLDQHPRVNSFGRRYVEAIARKTLVLQLFLWHMALSIMVLITAPSIVKSTHIELHDNIAHYLKEEWSQGCPDGIANSSNPCNFIKHSFVTATRPNIDAVRYFHEELINSLWLGEQLDDTFIEPSDNAGNKTYSASSSSSGPSVTAPSSSDPQSTFARRGLPLGGALPIGSLLLRGTWQNSAYNSIPCEAINQSTITLHSEVPAVFDCTSEWTLSIPFSLDKTSALALAREIRIPTVTDRDSNFAIIAHLAFVHPSTMLYAQVKAILTFPSGGGSMPRMAINVLDSALAGIVLPWLIIKIISTCFAWFTHLRFWKAGVAKPFELVADLFSLLMVATAYGLLSHVSIDESHVGQLDYHPPGFDSATEQFNTAMSLLGFFVFSQVLYTARYAFFIDGLNFVPDIIVAAFFEIMGLLLIFLVWCLGFICIALAVFGSTETSYATFGAASRHVLGHFLGQHDFEGLTENYPTLGPLYFFTLDLFVVFFAMNLLIAVITAPLEVVKKNNLLQHDAYVLTRANNRGSRWGAIALWLKKYFLWSLCALATNATPFTTAHWCLLHRSFDAFYTVPNSHHVDVSRKVVEQCAEVLHFAETLRRHDEGSVDPFLWRSDLLDTVIQRCLIDDDIALAFVVIAISTESRFSILRDARLMEALREYESFSALQKRVQSLQATLARDARAHAFRIVDLLERREDDRVHREAQDGGESTVARPADRLSMASRAGKVQAAALDRNQFIFSIHATLTQHAHVGFFAVVTLVFTGFMMSPFTTTFTSSAFLTRTLHLGLRDMEMKTRCFNENCTRAWSINKTFEEVDDMDSYLQWLDQVLSVQLFPSAFGNNGSVLLDPRIRRISPVTFTQLRAPIARCNDTAAPVFRERLAALQYECQVSMDMHTHFETSDSPVPQNRPALVPPSAYAFDSGCPVSITVFRGKYHDYPCSGLQVEVGDGATLAALMQDQVWFTRRTRLVIASAQFAFGPSMVVEFAMYAEFGEGGSAALTQTFATVIKSGSKLTESFGPFILFRVLLGLELLYVASLGARFTYNLFVKKLPPALVKHQRPSMPVFTVIMAVATFIVASAPQVTQAYDNSVVTILAVIYMEFHLTGSFLFPAATLMSKKVKHLQRALFKAFSRTFYVVPFFIIAIWAFQLSSSILFGRYVTSFGRLRWSLQRMTLMALTGEVTMDDAQADRFFETQVMVVLFFTIALVLLANLFLAMVTSATMDANEDRLPVALAEGVLRLSGRQAIHGKFLVFFLHVSRRFAHAIVRIEDKYNLKAFTRRTRQPAMMFRDGRALFPSEVLMTVMPPIRINALLEYFTVDVLNQWAHGVLIPFLLEQWFVFQAHRAHEVVKDSDGVKAEEKECIAAAVSTLAPSMSGGGRLMHKNKSASVSDASGSTSRFHSFERQQRPSHSHGTLRRTTAAVKRRSIDFSTTARASQPPNEANASLSQVEAMVLQNPLLDASSAPSAFVIPPLRRAVVQLPPLEGNDDARPSLASALIVPLSAASPNDRSIPAAVASSPPLQEGIAEASRALLHRSAHVPRGSRRSFHVESTTPDSSDFSSDDADLLLPRRAPGRTPARRPFHSMGDKSHHPIRRPVPAESWDNGL